MAIAISMVAGVVGAFMLVWGICVMFDSITNTSWDITLSEIIEWLHSPKFLKGLVIFLSSFLAFGFSFLAIGLAA